MKSIVRLIGITMVGIAIGTMQQDLPTGLCIGLFVFGVGLVVDSLRK